MSEKILCPHCNNVTPHQMITSNSFVRAFDKVDDEVVAERYTYYLFQCSTCDEWTLLGGFEIEQGPEMRHYPVVYPQSPDLHLSVPIEIRRVYSEASRIRSRAPNAFAGQIRRALEFLCKNQNATGKTLYNQLSSLVEKGIIPPTLAEMTTLIRLIGNIGVHASDMDIDEVDAELIDEFFRTIIEYVYVAPSKIEHLKERLNRTKSKGEDN